MELRLDDIRKKQENVIMEMERAVFKRETIQLKYMDKDKEGSKGKSIINRNPFLGKRSDSKS